MDETPENILSAIGHWHCAAHQADFAPQVETQNGNFNDAFETQGISGGHARNKRHPNSSPDRGDDSLGIANLEEDIQIVG